MCCFFVGQSSNGATVGTKLSFSSILFRGSAPTTHFQNGRSGGCYGRKVNHMMGNRGELYLVRKLGTTGTEGKLRGPEITKMRLICRPDFRHDSHASRRNC